MVRIAALYLPLIDILIENSNRLSNSSSSQTTAKPLSLNLSVLSTDSAFTKQNGGSFVSSQTLSPPNNLTSSASLSNGHIELFTHRHSETSSVLGVIAGNSKLQDHLEAIIGPISDSDSLSSADDTNFKNLSKRTSSSLITGSTNNSDNITFNANSINISASIALTENSAAKSYTVTRKDKMDNSETKDLLICLIFVLKNLSHGKF